MSEYQPKGNSGNLATWIIPILFLFIFPPIGVLLVVLKLFSGSRPRGRHPYYAKQEGTGPIGARTTAAQPAAPAQKAKKGRTRKNGSADLVGKLMQKGKKLTTFGALLSAIFAFVILSSLYNSAYWLLNGELQWFVSDLFNMLPNFCFLAAGLGCLGAGVRKRKQANRYRTYLAMIGPRKSISVSSLASASGLSLSRVREDLEDMLEEGIFPTGFLDYGGDLLVLSGEGLQDTPSDAPAPQPPKTEQREEDAILSEIRAVNDAVANEKLSAQIDRIGVITAKILEYQHSRPEKAPQLHSFLSYYLPTTLKILKAYAQMESQEVSGENITSAMERIEGMMDKVVEGFEKQLDQLFQGDAMDITADVEVLERMLAKDGLSSNQGMTL